MFWPKGAEPTGTDRDKLDKNWGKADEIEKGNLDIGKRLPATRKSDWYCIEQAEFLAWLLRQIGYKVQYKNIIPSSAAKQGSIDTEQQTSAIDVWYDNGWHLYDPFESFSDENGGLSAYTKKKGDVAAPYHDAYVYKWERGTFGGLKWNGPDKPTSEEYMKTHMETEGKWTRVVYLKEAGATFKNLNPRIRMGLEVGSSNCGWGPDGKRGDTLAGAVYRGFGRPVGGAMGDVDAPRAIDEIVQYNVFSPGTLEVVLIVWNASKTRRERFDVEILRSNTEYLGVQIAPAYAFAGTLGPGRRKRLSLTLRVRRRRVPPPNAVTGINARVVGNRVCLFWPPVTGADVYDVYRSNGGIVNEDDLANAQHVARVLTPAFEQVIRSKRPLQYAIVAVDARGRRSCLDVEERSSVVAQSRSVRRSHRLVR